MAEPDMETMTPDVVSDSSNPFDTQDARPKTPRETINDINAEVKPPATPVKGMHKPLPKEPAMTPRIKKKVPWKGKNIMVLVPRDDERGQPGRSPKPLNQAEIDRMFASWRELGYSVDGFDLLVEGFQVPGTDDSQSRDLWPNQDDLDRERAQRKYQVTLPDLNAWRDYVNELQEAKLRALGVSFADEEPLPPSPTSNPSRQPSVQYPPLPFSPPLPTSSASSNHAMAGFPFPGQFLPGTQSPSIASPVPFGHAPGKFNPRQSISFPTSSSPFQFPTQSPQGWPNIQGLNRVDSPSLVSLNGILSPQSPYGIDGFQQTSSPALHLHQRHQSLGYLPQQAARASPRLQEVREDEEEEEVVNKSPSKTPEPVNQNPDNLQAEIDEAEYHLEESLRHQLEHEDYNPQPVAENGEQAFVPGHDRRQSGSFALSERFASEPGKPMVLHHPRPHSRGQSLSLSQTFFRDHEAQEGTDEAGVNKLTSLKEIPESHKGDEAHEIETNPSNLGTPVPDFEFAVPYNHQKTVSTASNPWQETPAVASNGAHHSGHGSKSSFSKLNVKAPEFKFNPTSTFTPGLYNFSSNNFQPAVVYNAHLYGGVESPPIHSHLPYGQLPHMSANASTFVPGQSDFSFSSSGPKFRPDAPSFTPFQSLSNPIANPPPAPTTGRLSHRTDSIFGNIDIQAIEAVKPVKKSKAIPIIRPSSGMSAESPSIIIPGHQTQESSDGRVVDDSRIKRARSAAPDGDDVPRFAERPNDAAEYEQAIHRDDHSGAEYDGDNTLPVDTSISSIVTSDQMDTKATTAAPSETSPGAQASNYAPFDFSSKFEGNKPFSEQAVHSPVHKKSLSAKAQPFTPGALSFGVNTTTDQTKAVEPAASAVEISAPAPTAAPFAPTPSPVPDTSNRPKLPAKKPKGLAASRFAATPSPVQLQQPPPVQPKTDVLSSIEHQPVPELEPDVAPVQSSVQAGPRAVPPLDRELTFEEIDEIMQQFEADPSMAVNKTADVTEHQPATLVNNALPVIDVQFATEQQTRDGTSSTPRQYHTISQSPVMPVPSTEVDDPFVDPPLSPRSPAPVNEFGEPRIESEMASDWEGAFTEDEHDKLENRAQFFDGRVNEVVGTLLASRLEPLEKALFSIQDALGSKSRRAPSTRREVRNGSAEMRESDADDEDDEPVPPRSMSPRRDRRMEQIRLVVTEALAAQQRNSPPENQNTDVSDVLNALAAMKEQFAHMKANSRAEDLFDYDDESAVIREAEISKPEIPFISMEEFQEKVTTLQERIEMEQTKVEREISERRAAEDAAAELHRKLQAAETRVEVEIINRSVFDQRVVDLEERLRHQEDVSEKEIVARRGVEDKLAEVQRSHRIASEEEDRLRGILEEKDHKIKIAEQAAGKNSMRMVLLEAAQTNSTQSQSEMTNRVNALEGDLRSVRQDNNHWRSEAERADEIARRKGGELAHVLQENKHIQKSLDTLQTQLEENERLRESWRVKFLSLQDDMGQAAREVAEENARRIKKDQAMLARQEVLDARLQAEAKTRERLEVELDRLQVNERSGMRAVNECKRLEDLLGEMRTENHKLQQTASRYQREFEEARESGVSEVKRTRMALETDLDAANHQVNVVREELEEQNSKLRAEIDSINIAADTAKAQHEMLLEEAQATKDAAVAELESKHQGVLEDKQTRHQRQVSIAAEDAQKTEQNLLERLSLSASKIEHLQDRLVHLEDKLEIAKEAAAAAAQAAKSAGVDPGPAAIALQSRPVARKLDLPEKVSPQALRESIMVLQEQLQAREQRIEELEHTVAKSDPDAPSKISKRDDEISWLRELLAVRHGDLQDIITALSSDGLDREAVKDAAIRLKANLQMEEQERERAMNGGSAINLPNIAQTIQAASPRVAQAVGPIAAAWGNWRKGNQGSFRSISGVLGSPGGASQATPSKSRSSPAQQSSLLSGLLTPPASNLRQTPTVDDRPQPTAFSSTGRRFTSQGSMQSRSRRESSLSHLSDKPPTPEETTPPRHQDEEEAPRTPPMMGENVYDEDAQPGDFDDHDFFEEEEED